MRAISRTLFVLPLALTTALPVPAQDASEERDRSFLTALIEDNLEAPGLSVRIDGFEGALSSEASLDVLTVSDDNGPWLRLEDVVLDWNRSALLRGRLEVTQLSAGLIAVERAPLPPEGVEALPDAGASGGFSLPNLPVSVDIGRVEARRINLGEALLGQPLSLSLEAQAQLADGSGSVTLSADRLDGVRGRFEVTASFAADTTDLTIDLSANEAEGGLAATLLGLPGAPAIDLAVTGGGPLDAFGAEIVLASEGVPRLAGQVTLAAEETGRRFGADLSGNVTSLFAPRFEPFFGDNVALQVSAIALTDGGTRLDTLSVDTQSLQLDGRAAFGADGWPQLLDITGQLRGPDGAPVLLPTAERILLDGATFSLRHDPGASDDIVLDLSAEGLEHPALTVGQATLSATGQLNRDDAGAVVEAASGVTLLATGMTFADDGLGQAVGPRVDLRTDVDWQAGGPVRIEGLSLRGPAAALDGDIILATDGTALPVTLALQTAVADLGRLSGLAGRPLGGSADLQVRGSVAPIGGAFDIVADGRLNSPATGIAQADAVLAGQSNLTLAARRDTTGTYLDNLSILNAQAEISASASLLAEDAPARVEGAASLADLTARLLDGAVIDPRLAGEVLADVSLGQNDDGAWTGNARIDAPQGVALTAAGTLTGPAGDVDFDLSVPDVAAFVPQVPGALTLDGRAFVETDGWRIDARAAGPWQLAARVNGAVTGGTGLDLTYDATLPDITGPVPALAEALPGYSGPLQLNGTLQQAEAGLRTDTLLQAPEDVTLRVRGVATGAAPQLDVAVTVPRLQVFVPQVSGLLSVEAALSQQAGDWSLSARAAGPEGARATVESVLTATPFAADFSLSVPRVAAFAPGVPGLLDVAGRAEQDTAGVLGINVAGTGPYSSDLNLTARLPEAGPEATARVRLPNLGAIVPQLPGALDATVDASQRDGAWGVALDAAGPFGATLDLDGTVAGAPLDVDLTLAVPNIAPLTGGIAGPLRVSGNVAQPGTDYALDLDIAGPSGTRAQVSGTAATDGTLGLSVTGQVPLGLANSFAAPQRLGGTAQVNLTVNGPPALGSVRGTIRTTDAAVSLPTLRNGLEPIAATVTLDGSRALIDATASLQTGGQIRLSGPVALQAPFSGDLGADFNVVLEDPQLYTANVLGQIAVRGPLTGGAQVSGQVTIDGAEIAVPSSGLTAVGDLPPIDHLGATRPVQRTLARAGQSTRAATTSDSGSGAVYGLDLTVTAPGRIFVRGRGLDAELGGTLRVTGNTAAPVTSGGFELVRGRLDILQQRFDLDEGTISFQGDLVPNIRLVAVTETDALTASISVEGPADDIGVTFGSTPEVPQEEILAQIFFGRDLTQLSPFQALQLANSVAVLAGRSSGGLLERLRGGAGLDDIDVTTDAEGNTALRAGKYISDNVYTDVQVGQDGNASVSLNIDLTPNLTARGSTGASGESSLGLFFEKDY